MPVGRDQEFLASGDRELVGLKIRHDASSALPIS
jgi:hypothetical protein